MHTQNPLFKCANWILTNMEKSHCPRGPQALFRSMVFLRESSHLCSGSPSVLWHLYLWTWVVQCHHRPPIPAAWAWEVTCFGQQGTGGGLNACSLHFPRVALWPHDTDAPRTPAVLTQDQVWSAARWAPEIWQFITQQKLHGEQPMNPDSASKQVSKTYRGEEETGSPSHACCRLAALQDSRWV